MATMTHPRMMPTARAFPRAQAQSDARATVAPEELKGSIMYGIGVCLAILTVALMTVLTPFLGPPADAVAALNQAQETQALAHSYLAMHPEQAVPTGDARAWGFEDSSAPAEAPCPQYWAGSAGAC